MSRTTRALQMAAELSARCDRQARRIRELTEAVVAGDAQLRTAETELVDLRENASQQAADHAEDAQMIAGLTAARDAETLMRERAVAAALKAEAAANELRDIIASNNAAREAAIARADDACRLLSFAAGGHDVQAEARAFFAGQITEGGHP